ncbi:MAG: hypothetical protein EBZ67_07725, partial [Chitinophagia bacterium]|nr:hypothetical protein [Chitinophagia bacterium]
MPLHPMQQPEVGRGRSLTRLGRHVIHFQAILFLSAFLLAGLGGPSARAADRLPAGTESIRAYADTVITGQVKNDQGEPLMGVSVSVTGSKVGYITDAMGGYSIKASGKATLVFTYMGYVSQTVQAAGRTKLDVVMQQNTQSSLEDVVVTALGVSKVRRGLGYAVQEVKGKEFTEGRMNNIASALTGKIAGVDAIQTNAGAGSSSRVVVRGNTSLNGNQQPLYVVDGMPIDNQNRGPVTSSTALNVDRGDGISNLNPDDIATMSVLKGGAAAALYGSQAANGVILITTKKGLAQKGVGVEYTMDYNTGQAYIFPNYQYEYGQGNDGVKPATAAAALSSGRLAYGAKMDGSMVLQFDGVARPYSPVYVKDNIKNFYRPSENFLNSIAMTAGNSKNQMRLSFSNLDAKDQQPNSKFSRKTINLNTRSKLGPNDMIIVEGSVQYNDVQGINRPNVGYAELNAAWPVYLAANVVDVRNMAGTDPSRPGINVNTGRELEWNPVPAAINPYYASYQIANRDDQKRWIARTSVQVNVLKNLFIKGTAGLNTIYYSEYNYVPKTNAFTPLGYYRSGKEYSSKLNLQLLMNYNERFLSDKLGLNLMVGANSERNKYSSNTANGTEWVVPNFYSITNLVSRDLANNSSLSLLGVAPDGTNSVNLVISTNVGSGPICHIYADYDGTNGLHCHILAGYDVSGAANLIRDVIVPLQGFGDRLGLGYDGTKFTVYLNGEAKLNLTSADADWTDPSTLTFNSVPVGGTGGVWVAGYEWWALTDGDTDFDPQALTLHRYTGGEWVPVIEPDRPGAYLPARVAALAPSSGGVTDHGALTGLGDDDHTQYQTAGVSVVTTPGTTLSGVPRLVAATASSITMPTTTVDGRVWTISNDSGSSLTITGGTYAFSGGAPTYSLGASLVARITSLTAASVTQWVVLDVFRADSVPVYEADARLTNARTPTAHAASHGSGGTDAITVAQSQVTGLSSALAGKLDSTDPGTTALSGDNHAIPRLPFGRCGH